MTTFLYCHLASEIIPINENTDRCEICDWWKDNSKDCKIPDNTILEALQVQLILHRIQERDFTLINLFQVKDYWQANLKKGDKVWEFGRAPTLLGALEQAFSKAQKEVPLTLEETTDLLESI